MKSTPCFGRSGSVGGGQLVAVEAGRPVDVFGGDRRAHQRALAAGEHRHVAAAGQFHDAPRVNRGPRQRHVAGDRHDAGDLQFVGRGQRQKDRDGVVLSGIGVDDDAALHVLAARLEGRGRSSPGTGRKIKSARNMKKGGVFRRPFGTPIPVFVSQLASADPRLAGLDRRRLPEDGRVRAEQRPPLERGRAEERIAMMHAVLLGEIIERHHADRLGQRGIVARVAEQFVAEDALVKRLMLDADGGQDHVGGEELARHPADAHRDVGQLGIELREVLVDDEAGRVDDRAAGRDMAARGRRRTRPSPAGRDATASRHAAGTNWPAPHR